MNKKNLTVFILIAVTVLGGFFRFYKIEENPPSLNGDEVSMAYDAYSILETGRDQYGKFMPLTFQSVGDFKNPLPIYLMTIPIKIFGLNEFSVRFQNAVIGTIMIPIFFLFLLKVIKDRLLAFVAAFLLSISSWHIFYSRVEYETLIASFFVLLGVYFFIKMSEGGRKWAILSAFFFILTMYTAPAPRLFVPVFIIVLLLFNIVKFKTQGKHLTIFITTCVILGLPLAYATLFQGAGTRLSMVLISNDIEFQRYVLLESIRSVSDVPLLILFWVKRYLNYLQPDFLFISGLNITAPKTFGLGVLYLYELPFLVIGIIEFIRRNIPHKAIFVIWLLTGIIPDSITNNQLHAGRLLHIAPVLIFITAMGAIQFFKWILGIRGFVKIAGLGVYALFIVLTLIHAFLTIAVHFPKAKGESIDEGLKEVALYVEGNKDKFDQIVIDPRRGVEGPYLVSNPYLYILFYSKYDPQIYQTEPKVFSQDATYFFKFNKYTFRSVDWSKDQKQKGTLFVASPWSFPEKGLKEGELLKKIYMSSGFPAYYIVSPK